jgi:uncharacterized protein YkwD
MRKLKGWRLTLAGGFAGLAVAFAGVLGIGQGDPAQALTNCTVSDMSVDAEEQAFLGLINAYRAQNGLGALTMSTHLNRAATWHGADMGINRRFSHTDSLGRSPSTRARNCDYPGDAGENIAAGTQWSSAQSAFNAWRNSSGHNANMLTSYYTKIGIARVYTAGSPYGWYWVTNFGLVNDGTSGGGGSTNPTSTPTRTPTRTPTQPPTSSSPASITSPGNGSTLAGASVTFSWSAASGAQEYFFYAGTSQGANNIVGRSTGTSRSTTVTNLPTNGSTVHVRLWTRFSSGWQYRDTTYTAASSGSGGGTQQQKAAITSPAPGSRLGTSQAFSWSAGSGASQYFFYLGTTQGSNNIVGINAGTSRSVTVNNIPRGGQTLYVRLWTNFGGPWQYTDYTYLAPN